MDPWLIEHLVCPRDRSGLRHRDDYLVCDNGHAYPIVGGIPVMLLEEAPPTHHACGESLVIAAGEEPISDKDDQIDPQGIDSYVQEIVVGTCGNLYGPLVGRLSRYPIPDLRLPRGQGESLLDIGCNWGRWCVSAARLGYRAVGVDPCLESIMAARRVARQLDVEAHYLVGDSRFLPFPENSFEIVFSYSVFQHLEKADVLLSLAEIACVLRPLGISLVQMPNVYGLHNLWVQARNGFRDTGFFGVRYWRPRELRDLFERAIGPTNLSVDGFFSLNAQASDRDLLPFRYRLVISCSEMLCSLSVRFPSLAMLADSLYVHSLRSEGSETAFAQARTDRTRDANPAASR